MQKDLNEMIYHLNNIINKIDSLTNNTIDINKLHEIKKTITEFISILKNQQNISKIDLDKLKNISNIIYNFNYDNSFSEFTEYLSNELYAFEFLLQETRTKVIFE